MGFERIDSEQIWQGHIGGVRVDTFRYDDGEEAKREIVSHPGAVTVLPFDGERIWLVRQPREPVGEQSLLELPAGKIETESKGGTAPLCNPPGRTSGSRSCSCRSSSWPRPSLSSVTPRR